MMYFPMVNSDIKKNSYKCYEVLNGVGFVKRLGTDSEGNHYFCMFGAVFERQTKEFKKEIKRVMTSIIPTICQFT